MQQAHVTSPIDPIALTNAELIRFAEDFVHGDGMPQSFQQELLRRFTLKSI